MMIRNTTRRRLLRTLAVGAVSSNAVFVAAGRTGEPDVAAQYRRRRRRTRGRYFSHGRYRECFRDRWGNLWCKVEEYDDDWDDDYGGGGLRSDIDQDTLPDYRDQCPAEYGPRDNNGCPRITYGDSDGDTVPDTEDRCRYVPGHPAKGGCPVRLAPGGGEYYSSPSRSNTRSSRRVGRF
ncbi:hypothetical protein [Haloarchaeobius sp. TZWWS8]|uniref:hypothetical protein n=1 Tax=Haloarchaeobius sp. TZWWS8 TaxID=3446121 RepID=UPI003EB75869